MKPHSSRTACLVVFLTLVVPTLAHAQPLRWFGSRPPEKASPTKSPLPDPRRVTAIKVEIAWLADPVTFPYYLEAHVHSAQHLEVRGYIPNKAVRDHALRIAQVYSSATVTDAMKEHPSLLVRPSQMSPQQLQSNVLTSLRAALPGQHNKFKVACGNDGKVLVTGPVNTYDEQIAVSHSLRRLHGCTSVQNQTSVPEELARAVANPPRDHFVQEQPRKLGPIAGAKEVSKDPPVVKVNGPDLGVKDGLDVLKVELPVKTIPVAELEKLISDACPKALNVEVTYSSPTNVRILIEARAAEVSAIAESVLALPELKSYRPELQFKISP